MSKTSVLLVASLALNALLVVLLAVPFNRSGALSADARSAGEIKDIVPVPEVEDTSHLRVKGSVPEISSGESRAESSSTLDALVTELRSREVDDSLIRSLIVAEAERRFSHAARQLLGSNSSPHYWEARVGREPLAGTKLAEFQRLRREKHAAIATLFGQEYADGLETQTANAYAYANATFTQFDYLPADKRLKLIEYLETAASTMNRSSGIAARLGRNQLANELEKEQQVSLLLGPVLFDEFVKRSSGTSQNLREELGAFHPSKAEFDGILSVERDFAARMPALGIFPLDPTSTTKIQATQEQKREAIRGVLGDSRFAEYERATDWSFRHLDTLARDMGLDPSVARSGYSRLEQARSRGDSLVRNADMRDPTLQSQIEALRRDLQARLVEDFGLTDLSEQEAQMLLGPALMVYSQRGTGWAVRRGTLTAR